MTRRPATATLKAQLPEVPHLFGLFKTKAQKEAASLRRLTQQTIANMERLCASGKIDANDVALVERQISIRKSRLENLRLLEKGEDLSELENTPSSLRWHQSRRDELENEVTILGQSADALIKHLRQKQRQ